LVQPKLEGPTQTALAEFRIITEHIGTRDLVQEFLAFKVFPTMKEWAMPKLEGKKEGRRTYSAALPLQTRDISKYPAKNGWIQSK
jgi:hypothetical protein